MYEGHIGAHPINLRQWFVNGVLLGGGRTPVALGQRGIMGR